MNQRKYLDFVGNELQIGDVVIYVEKFGRCGAKLSFGEIKKLNDKMATITTDGCWQGLRSANCKKSYDFIMKMSDKYRLFYKMSMRPINGIWVDKK